MKTYLKVLNLWETIESEVDPPPLGPNPTVAQMKIYEDAKSRKLETLTCLHSALSEVIFTRIMARETPKEAWEKLREEFDGSDRVKTIKLLTLKREFEMLRTKEADTVKEYSAKLLGIVNKIRLFGETFPDSKVVEKKMIRLPARFESKISAIEKSCDLKTLSVAESINKLQAQEQRSSIRDEEVAEVAFQAKHKGKQPVKDNKKIEGDKVAKGKTWKESSKKGKFPPCSHCNITNHQERDCWFKGKPSIQCRFCRKMGHIEKNCRVKQNQPQQHHVQQASFTEESEKKEERFFMASHEENTTNKFTWFIDVDVQVICHTMSSCFIHLTSQLELKLGWEMVKC